MDIKVNGEPFDLAPEPAGARTVGELLGLADAVLARAGAVIVGIRIDGRTIDADSFSSVRDLPEGAATLADIDAEGATDVRVKAVETLLELLGAAGESVGQPGTTDWQALAHGASEIADAFGGLFPADELGWARGFAGLTARAAAEAAAAGIPGAATRAEMAAQTGKLGAIFGERLDELRDPAAEMRRTAALYAAQAEELRELPVYLQTGREDRAMKAFLLFIEIFNKVIRLMPLLSREGVTLEGLVIGGRALPEFYASFNEVLRGLSKALEDKDAVLIGDLAEYEVAPRMASFFSAVGEALERR